MSGAGDDTGPCFSGDDDRADGGDNMLGGDDTILDGDREPQEEGGDAMEEPPVEDTETEILFILSIPVFFIPFCF